MHRHGVERLLSVYNHWVKEVGSEGLRRLIPDPGALAYNLPPAINREKVMRYHCRGQAFFLGGKVGNYDAVLPMDSLEDLPRLVSEKCEVPLEDLPPMDRRNSRKYDVNITDEERLRLEAFTAYDTLVGWDGATKIIT